MSRDCYWCENGCGKQVGLTFKKGPSGDCIFVCNICKSEFSSTRLRELDFMKPKKKVFRGVIIG